MIPRNVFLVFALSLIVAALVLSTQTKNALATHPATPNMTKVFCYADSATPAFYFSRIFDVTLQAKTKLSTLPLSNAFFIYLVEEYDYKSSSGLPSGCTLFETLSQAEARKQELIAQARRANKQVVEVNWNPGPIVEKPQGDESTTIGPKVPPPSHTFCALGNADTMYFSDVFVGPLNVQAWNNAFKDYLSKTYGFEAEVDATCTPLNTTREAERVLSARIGGVRYNRHKAVETGWKFGQNAVTSTRPRPKPTPKPDDDPEPVAQRPASAPPPADIRDFAAKEGPLVLDYCQKDRLLSKIFDCYRVQRSVYNYRMEHGASDSLASLFTQEKVNLAEAIGTGLGLWVRARATADKFDNRASNCIEQKFNLSFYDKPYVSKMNELYAAAIAACR